MWKAMGALFMPVDHPGYATIQNVHMNTPSLTADGMACRPNRAPDTLTHSKRRSHNDSARPAILH
ncbi:MAG: hypothetical protein ACREXO_01545 [Advenella sp.]